jgi:hypothetical protein
MWMADGEPGEGKRRRELELQLDFWTWALLSCQGFTLPWCYHHRVDHVSSCVISRILPPECRMVFQAPSGYT